MTNLKLGDLSTYIIYTPNLGLEIAVPGREREQGRFRGSIEGARGSKREQRESISTKWALAGEQTGGTLVNSWSRAIES